MQIKPCNIHTQNFRSTYSISFGVCKNAPASNSLYLKTDCFEKTNFITPLLSKEVFENAKNIVIQSLFDKNPKESIVLVKNNEVLFQSTGDEFAVDIPEKIMDEAGYGDIIIVHSHTPEKNGLTAPLSLADLENLIYNNEIKTICAINNKGEYSILEKIPGVNYDETVSEDIDSKCCAGFIHIFNNKKKKEFIKFLKTLDSIKSDDKPETFLNKMLLIEDKLDEYYDYATSLKSFPRYMDNFWRKNARKFGFNYYSNFSF